MRKVNTVVIGSGISGLTIAALIAKKGREVILLEAAKRPGGSIRRFYRKGFPFDTGFHYTGGLGDKGALKAIWNFLNITNYLDIIPFPQKACDELFIEPKGINFKVYFSYNIFEDELIKLFPNYKREIKEYTKLIKNICNQIPFFNFDLPLANPSDLYNSSLSKSLTDTINALKIYNNTLATILSYPIFFYGVPPKKASLLAHSMVTNSFLSGTFWIKNGGQGIINAFIKLLKALNVEIKTDSCVNKILIKNGKVYGVEINDELIQAQNVVYTGHPALLLDIVNNKFFRPAYITRLKELENTPSMFIVFATAENKYISPYKWHNCFLLNENIELFSQKDSTLDKSSLMLTALGLRDSNATQNTFCLLRPFNFYNIKGIKDINLKLCQNKSIYKSNQYYYWKKAITLSMLETIEEKWNIPKDKINVLETASPITFWEEILSPEGAVYGISHNIYQFAPTARTKLPGLWLSGQSTLMPGIVGASLSALITVGEMCGGLSKFWEEIKQCL